MPTACAWDEELARAVSARQDALRSAVRDGAAFANEYRHRRWPMRTPTPPVAVYLAREGRYYTLAFDVDAPREAAVRQAAAIVRVLAAAGIAYVEAESGP